MMIEKVDITDINTICPFCKGKNTLYRSFGIDNTNKHINEKYECGECGESWIKRKDLYIGSLEIEDLKVVRYKFIKHWRNMSDIEFMRYMQHEKNKNYSIGIMEKIRKEYYDRKVVFIRSINDKWYIDIEKVE